jgi:hypothetical protein
MTEPSLVGRLIWHKKDRFSRLVVGVEDGVALTRNPAYPDDGPLTLVYLADIAERGPWGLHREPLSR